MHSVTLIADPVTAKLSPEAAADASGALERAGAAVAATKWLAPRIACELVLANPSDPEPGSVVRNALAGRPIDVVVQPTKDRRKKLLVADMESTIIVNEMVDELAELLGIGGEVAEITRRAMNGDIPFRDALRQRATLLGGLEEEALKWTCERIAFMPGALTLVRTMRAHGARTALVSGGVRVFPGYVAPRAAFDWHYANDLVVRDGVVIGQVAEPILGREAKRDALLSLCAELDLAPDDAMAVGDGANDIDMVAAAGVGVAFRAKPALRRAARHRIDHGDLTALLYMQGYRREEFVSES